MILCLNTYVYTRGGVYTAQQQYSGLRGPQGENQPLDSQVPEVLESCVAWSLSTQVPLNPTEQPPSLSEYS